MPIYESFEIERGDAYLSNRRLMASVPGDWTDHKLTWVVKSDISATERLITKKNTLAGGSDDELEAVLNNGSTEIYISVQATDTQTFTATKYDHDCIAVDNTDATIEQTIFKGVMLVHLDVQTPFDSSAVPELVYDYTKTVLLDIASDGTNTVIKNNSLFTFTTGYEEISDVPQYNIISDSAFFDNTVLITIPPIALGTDLIQFYQKIESATKLVIIPFGQDSGYQAAAFQIKIEKALI